MATEHDMAPDGDQDTPAQLIFGKYKSIEDAEAAYKEAERKINEEAIRADRAERLLTLFKPEHDADRAPETPSPGSEDVSVDETAFDDSQKQYISTLLKAYNDRRDQVFLERVGNLLNSRQTQAEQRSQFYAENPDLKDYEEDVAIEAQKLMAENQGRNVDPAAARKELAKRTKDRLRRIVEKLGKKAPLHLADGTPGSDSVGAPEPEEEPNAEKILTDYVKEVRATKQKRMNFRG